MYRYVSIFYFIKHSSIKNSTSILINRNLSNLKKDKIQRMLEEKAANIQQIKGAKMIQRVFRGYLARRNYKRVIELRSLAAEVN